jgi:hypothetical protein
MIKKMTLFAINLLLNLEATQRGRSGCFQMNKSYSLKVGKRVYYEYRIGFYEMLTKPRMKAI